MHERDFHIVFAFNRDLTFPPSVDFNKVRYVSAEFVRRGANVTWLTINGKVDRSKNEGMTLKRVKQRRGRIGWYLRLVDFVRFCRREKADCVYADEWLFLRDQPLQRLIVQIGLKIAGVKCVFDQRDPYIEHLLATKALDESSPRHRFLKLVYRVESRFTDLAILPSEVYADRYRQEYRTAKAVLGAIRGVDPELFNPNVDGSAVRSKLGFKGSFVVGWFGMMNAYRLIEEVLVPLIENSREFLPDASFVVGGHGKLKPVLEGLMTKDPKPDLVVTGFIDYADLPSFVAACDVLLCPLNLNYQFAKLASPLKILESLAVARPIIATETLARTKDYAKLEGVVWTSSDFEEFKKSLIMVHDEYDAYRQKAERQAGNFEEYSVRAGISKIADAVLDICK